MTGQEILAEEFERAGMRGYRADEVDAFLQKVAAFVDEQESKINDLTYKIQILAEKVEEYKADESDIRDALLNAQKLGTSIQNEAKAKAEKITRDARANAEELMEQAKAKVDSLTRNSLQKVNDEVAAAKRQREEEELRLAAIKREVSDFRTSVLKQYKAHLDLLSNMKVGEAAPEEAEHTSMPVEPVAEESAYSEISGETEESTVEYAEEIHSGIYDDPIIDDSIREEISEEEKAQTREYGGEIVQPPVEEEPKEEHPAPAKRNARPSYVEKFGELKFGGFSDKDR